MPPKKGKKGKGKAKKVKYVPDPDAPYRDLLNEEYYIPKVFVERRRKELIEKINTAITASLSGDASGDAVLSGEVPMPELSNICGTLDLCLSTEQVLQLQCMVAPDVKPEAELTDLKAFDRALTSEPGVLFADKGKLQDVLLNLLTTRILSYDAQVLQKPNPAFPTRVLSVIYSTGEKNIRKCFEALWHHCGSQYSLTPDNEKVRCLATIELKDVMKRKIISEPGFTDDELQHLVVAFGDANEDVIREDNFLFVMQNMV